MKYKYWLLLLATLISCSSLFAQVGQPYPPKIKSVSVDPATNDVTIRWTHNVDINYPVDYYIPRKLEYPRVQPTPTSYPIGPTVPYPDSIVVIPAAAGTLVDVARQAFCVTAISTVPGTNESSIDDYHYPSFLTTKIDTCSAEAVLRWTRYKAVNENLEETSVYHAPFNQSIEYEVWGYQGNPPFNQALAQKISDRIKDTTFNSPTLVKDKNYFFFVKVILPKGFYLPYGEEISYSNRISAVYRGVAVPMFIDIPLLEAKSNSIELNFQIDPTSELFSYSIERTQDLSHGFSELHKFSDKTLTLYVDNDVKTNERYYYRISATRCSTFVKRSDITNSIVLTSKGEQCCADLSWLSYAKPGSTYSVTRVVPDNNIVINNLTDSTYSDNITSLVQLGYDKFCYQITGIAPNGDLSVSAPSCFTVQPTVYMPNAIDPTSTVVNATTGIQRNQFGPIIDMNPTMYGFELTIFNRWGVKVFESTKKIGSILSISDHLWDGKHKGKNVEPGVYLYTINVYFPNSKTSLKGDISVFY